MKNAIKLALSIVICELAGIVGSIFTTSEIDTWYSTLIKPTLNPPGWVFGPVWTSLYALMGIALFIVWKNHLNIKNHFLSENTSKPWNPWSRRFWFGDWQKANIVAVFVVQLVLNTAWSYIFFGLHRPDVAFFELLALWISIVYVMVNFYRVSKTAAWLLLPYIVWVTFAGYLNIMIWLLN